MPGSPGDPGSLRIDRDLGNVLVASPTTITNTGSSAYFYNFGLTVNNSVVINQLSANLVNFNQLENNGVISNRLGGTLTNYFGTLNNNSGGFLTNDLSSTLANLGTLNNNFGALLSSFGTVTNSGRLNNANGATLDNFGSLSSTGALNNAGTLTINTLVLASQFSNSGLFQTNGGTTQLSGGAVHNAGGTIAVSAGGVVSIDPFVFGGTLENTGGTIGALGTFAQLDGITEGALTIKGVYTNAPDSRTNVLGTIINQGEIQVNSGGGLDSSLAMAGDAILQGGGAVTLANLGGGGTSAFLFRFGGTLTNVDNTIQGAGTIGGGSFGVIDNQAAGTIRANGPGQTLTIVGIETFTNAGTVQVDPGSTLLMFPTIVQTGGKTVVDGRLTLDEGETISGGLLAGNGVIDNSVQMTGGTIQPGGLTTPGVLTFSGDAHSSVVLSLTSTEFNELIDSTGNGLLLVNGNVMLGPYSLLNIDLLDGFAPSLGATFTIMGYTGLSGIFANAPTTGFVMDGFNWTIAYEATDIVLAAGAPVETTTSVPDSGAGTMVLLVLGLLSLPAARRGRSLVARLAC